MNYIKAAAQLAQEHNQAMGCIGDPAIRIRALELEIQLLRSRSSNAIVEVALAYCDPECKRSSQLLDKLDEACRAYRELKAKGVDDAK